MRQRRQDQSVGLRGGCDEQDDHGSWIALPDHRAGQGGIGPGDVDRDFEDRKSPVEQSAISIPQWSGVSGLEALKHFRLTQNRHA